MKPDVYADWDKAIAEGKVSDVPDEMPDSRIVPLVEELRAAGIVTYMSCSGHEADPLDSTARMGYLWIAWEHLSRGQAFDLVERLPDVWIRLVAKPYRCWSIAWYDWDYAVSVSAIRDVLLPE